MDVEHHAAEVVAEGVEVAAGRGAPKGWQSYLRQSGGTNLRLD